MSLKIIKAGLLDTLQDLGRYGFQHLGINPGGAMDRYAAGLANALLGKALHAPVIEMHFPAAQIFIEQPAIICITGADFRPCINDEIIPTHQPIAVRENSLLTFKGKQSGARCYLALANEVELQPWLQSYSTNLKAAAGGYKGRRLEKEDRIGFRPIAVQPGKQWSLLPWRYDATGVLSNEVEFIPGPEWDWLTIKSQTLLLNYPFAITPSSDRMGYRLQGGVLEPETMEQLVSSAVNFGTVQLLPNGQLIVLMADHQTTGGYPRIANVAGAHLPKLAQMNAGDEIRFVMITIAEAEEKFIAQQKYLQRLQNTCKLKMENWIQQHS